MSYTEYAAAFSLRFDPASVDYIAEHPAFTIYENANPLLTPGGRPVSDPSEELVRMIVTDMQLPAYLAHPGLSALMLFCFAADGPGSGRDPYLQKWEEHLENDPFVRMKTQGKPVTKPLDPDDPLFSFSVLTLTSLTRAINRMVESVVREFSAEDDDTEPFKLIIRHIYEGMDAFYKAAFQAVSALHHSGTVLPLMLVCGNISPEAYAKGVIALGMQPVGACQAVLAQAGHAVSFLNNRATRPPGDVQVQELIRAGEGDRTEFKSTLRWDIRAGKTNPVIERASLKTIAAFLNSSGGTLLIGVRDDGSTEGIETDKFFNEDKFLLHLWTLIRTSLGRDFAPYIRTRLEKMDDRTICVVTCQPAGRPAFLRQPGFDEEMFIRVGPSTNAMNISEALQYIGDHFGKGR